MCLYYDEEKTKSFRKKYAGRKTVTAYKVYFFSTISGDEGLYSVCFGLDAQVKPGIIKSNRRTTRFGISTDRKGGFPEINRGIHIFLKKAEAKNFVNDSFSCYGGHEVIVKVTCYIKDLVGTNKTETKAVFTQIHLSKKEYRKATK